MITPIYIRIPRDEEGGKRGGERDDNNTIYGISISYYSKRY